LTRYSGLSWTCGELRAIPEEAQRLQVVRSSRLVTFPSARAKGSQVMRSLVLLLSFALVVMSARVSLGAAVRSPRVAVQPTLPRRGCRGWQVDCAGSLGVAGPLVARGQPNLCERAALRRTTRDRNPRWFDRRLTRHPRLDRTTARQGGAATDPERPERDRSLARPRTPTCSRLRDQLPQDLPGDRGSSNASAARSRATPARQASARPWGALIRSFLQIDRIR
jgi:hypothetical protein